MKEILIVALILSSVICIVSSIESTGWTYVFTNQLPHFSYLSPTTSLEPVQHEPVPANRGPKNDKNTMVALGSHVRCLKELQAMKERLDENMDLGHFRKELLELSKKLAETNTIVINLKKELTELSRQSTETSQQITETNVDVLRLKKAFNATAEELSATKKELADMKTAVVDLKKDLIKNLDGLAETNAGIGVIKTELKTTLANLADVKFNSSIAIAAVASVDANLIAIQNDLNVTKAEIFVLKATTSSSDKPSSIGKIPASCADLQQLGNAKSGLYNIKSTKKIEIVFCDFSKPSTDAGFQNSIGFLDVKSSTCYFYFQLGNDFSDEAKSPIPFDKELLNVGGAYNKTNGKFTAPVTGKYFFSVSGVVVFPATIPDISYFQLTLYKNIGEIGRSFSDEMSGIRKHGTFNLHTTIDLIKGDQIWPIISAISPEVNLVGHGYTHFSGFLLDEDIVWST